MKKKVASIALVIIALGLLTPQNFVIPVKGASKSSYNKKSFWYYPWGKSITHKGVDIFAKTGADVVSATAGIVLFTGKINVGGNVVLILGPKWRLHYYAHLNSIQTSGTSWVNRGEKIGTVGASGNAAGKQPHLHYSIVTLIPYPWKADSSIQGWKKMFYLNPLDFF